MRRLLGLRGPARPSAPRHRFRNGRHRPQRPAGRVRGPPHSSPQRAAPPRPALRAVRAQLHRLRREAHGRDSAAPSAGSPAFFTSQTAEKLRLKSPTASHAQKQDALLPLRKQCLLALCSVTRSYPLLPCCGDAFDS